MKLNEEDGKVSSLNRRVMLLEVSLGYKVKMVESKTMSNEVTIEELDKSVREANLYKIQDMKRKLH